MVYSMNAKDSELLDKLLKEDDIYLTEPDYSGPEYNDVGDMDDTDFDKFVVQQLESQEWVSLVNG